MNKFPFQLNTDEDVILMAALIDDYEVQLALDTASTQTILDFNLLLMMGYTSKDGLEKVFLETANGVIEAQIFQIKTLDVLGVSRKNIEVLTYDFLQKGILSPYDGVIGLDFFFNGGQLTIDFTEKLLWFLE
jgi:hypothetical protein